MKFFEVRDPYYALIKAHSKDEAILLYIEHVGDPEDDFLLDAINEVERDYALIQFCLGIIDSGDDLNVNEVLSTFELNNPLLLLIDASLL